MGQMPPSDGMPGGPMGPGFFPVRLVCMVFDDLSSCLGIASLTT